MTAAASTSTPEPAQVLSKAVVRATEWLGLSQRELAGVLGMSEATTSRICRHKTQLDPESKEGELALLLLRMFRSLDALLGGDAQKLKAWMRAPNAHLAGVPAERIRRAEGLVHVCDYLDAMRGRL